MKKEGVSRKSSKSIKVHHKKVAPAVAFKTRDGKELRSLNELVHALETMSDDVFYHHVNAATHDFANWVRDVYQLHDLADELLDARTRDRAQVVLYRFVVKQHE